MSNLRQKTYGVFIRPYVIHNGGILFQNNLYAPSPDGSSYLDVKEGSPWMLYLDRYYTSLIIAKEAAKEVMDTIGLTVNDIMVSEILPVDLVASSFI